MMVLKSCGSGISESSGGVSLSLGYLLCWGLQESSIYTFLGPFPLANQGASRPLTNLPSAYLIFACDFSICSVIFFAFFCHLICNYL